MAAGAAEEGGDFEVGTWKLVLFFLLILVIDTLWEFVDERVTRSILRRGQKGLIHAWEQIKFEIMALGLVSLLLVVFEEYLLRICVKKSKDKDYAEEKDEAYDGRRLLAPAGHQCPDGKEPLWSSALIHKIHILIFLIAISHVLYALLSLGISMLSMRRFQAFEKTAQKGELLPLPVDQLQRQGESRLMFGIRQGIRQFTHPIDRPTYIALRRLFFERMQVDESYNFANFVTEFLMEEFAKVVRLEFLMWVIALVWIAFPEKAYAGFWLTAVFVILSISAGGKLHVIAMHLARQAYSLYYSAVDSDVPEDSCLPPSTFAISADPSKRSVPSLKGTATGSGGLGAGGRAFHASPRASQLYRPGRHHHKSLPNMPHPDHSNGVSHGQFSSEVMEIAHSGGAGDARAVMEHASSVPKDEDSPAYDLRAGSSSSNDSPPLLTAVGPPLSAASDGSSGDVSASLPGPPSAMQASTERDVARTSGSPEGLDNVDGGGGHDGDSDTPPSRKRLRTVSFADDTLGGKLSAGAGSELARVLSTERRHSLNAHHEINGVRNGEGHAVNESYHGRASRTLRAGQLTSPSSSESASSTGRGQGACMGLGFRSRVRAKRLARQIRGDSRRVKPWKEIQFEELFWFRRPRLLLRVFQYAYFENALSLAILVFAFWQEEPSMIGGGIGGARSDKVTTGSVIAGFVLLALDMLLLFHSAYFVLPVHALTAASACFNTPHALLELAKERNMRPDLVHFLEDTETAKGILGSSSVLSPSASQPQAAVKSRPVIPQHTDSVPSAPQSASAIPSAAALHNVESYHTAEGSLASSRPSTAHPEPHGPGTPAADDIDASDDSRIRTAQTMPAMQPASGTSAATPVVSSSPQLAQPQPQRARVSLARSSAMPAIMRPAPASSDGPGSGPSSQVCAGSARPRQRPSLSRQSCPVVNHRNKVGQEPSSSTSYASDVFSALLKWPVKGGRVAAPRPNLRRSSVTGASTAGVPSSGLAAGPAVAQPLPNLQRSSATGVVGSAGSTAVARPRPNLRRSSVAGPMVSSDSVEGTHGSKGGPGEKRTALEEMIESMAQARLRELQATPEGAHAVDLALAPAHSTQRMGLRSARSGESLAALATMDAGGHTPGAAGPGSMAQSPVVGASPQQQQPQTPAQQSRPRPGLARHSDLSAVFARSQALNTQAAANAVNGTGSRGASGALPESNGANAAAVASGGAGSGRGSGFRGGMAGSAVPGSEQAGHHRRPHMIRKSVSDQELARREA